MHTNKHTHVGTTVLHKHKHTLLFPGMSMNQGIPFSKEATMSEELENLAPSNILYEAQSVEIPDLYFGCQRHPS